MHRLKESVTLISNLSSCPGFYSTSICVPIANRKRKYKHPTTSMVILIMGPPGFRSEWKCLRRLEGKVRTTPGGYCPALTYSTNNQSMVMIKVTHYCVGQYSKLVEYHMDFWLTGMLLLVTGCQWLFHFYVYLSDGDFFTYTRREPVGVCGQIIPVSLDYYATFFYNLVIRYCGIVRF